MTTAQAVPSRKRKRTETFEIPSSRVSPFFAAVPWREAGYPSAKAARTAFWDDLCEVPTCRSALREFDRRTVSKASSARTVDVLSTLPDTEEILPTLEVELPDLKRFARQGGPDKQDLRGYTDSIRHSLPDKMEPTSSASNSKKRQRSMNESSMVPAREVAEKALGETMMKSNSDKRITTTHDPALTMHLLQHGIYPPDYESNGRDPILPNNIGELLKVIRQERQGDDSTEEDYKKYKSKKQQGTTEPAVVHAAFHLLSTTSGIKSRSNLRFINLNDMTNKMIPKPQPDSFDGADVEDLDSRVLDKLDKYIHPNKRNINPIVPNFLTEMKSPSGVTQIATQQASYWGAVGARAMLHLQSYGKRTEHFDNTAYTIVSILDMESLRIYCSHPTRNENRNRIEYHMNTIDAYWLTTSVGFKDAVRGWRNIREWAKTQRDSFIQAANARVNNQGEDSSSYDDFHSSHEENLDETAGHGSYQDGASQVELDQEDDGEDDVPQGSQMKRARFE